MRSLRTAGDCLLSGLTGGGGGGGGLDDGLSGGTDIDADGRLRESGGDIGCG